jgi:hypothetical protein
LRLAIIERNVNYTNPPGTNGETYFPNVFREMIPSSTGEQIVLPPVGSPSTHQFTYTEDAVWNMSEIAVVAFIQNDATQEIINAGSSFDEIVNAAVFPPAENIKEGQSGATSSFSFQVGNIGDSDEEFQFELTTNAPNDWSASYTVNGISSSGTTNILLPSNTTFSAYIDVDPGATPAFADYTLKITSTANPLAPAMIVSVSVISGVTDLIVNNTGGNGVTPGDASYWEDDFINGLNYAGNLSFAVSNNLKAIDGIEASAFGNVKNIYYNVGWTFPGLTDELCFALADFIDAGGNLFISGQDIGWETWDEANSPYWTPNTQDFFTNYLNAGFVSDGGTSNDPLTANMSDIFTTVPSADIANFYGGSYFYPDQLTAVNGAIPIFYYNNNVTKVAGVRSLVGSSKIVYLGIGVEMIASDTYKNEVLKTSHDWFYGIISSAEFTEQLAGITAFPNPADDRIFINLNNISGNFRFELVDVTGRTLMEERIAPQQQMVEINCSGFPSGLFFYRITNEKNESITGTLQVHH